MTSPFLWHILHIARLCSNLLSYIGYCRVLFPTIWMSWSSCCIKFLSYWRCKKPHKYKTVGLCLRNKIISFLMITLIKSIPFIVKTTERVKFGRQVRGHSFSWSIFKGHKSRMINTKITLKTWKQTKINKWGVKAKIFHFPQDVV